MKTFAMTNLEMLLSFLLLLNCICITSASTVTTYALETTDGDVKSKNVSDLCRVQCGRKLSGFFQAAAVVEVSDDPCECIPHDLNWVETTAMEPEKLYMKKTHVVHRPVQPYLINNTNPFETPLPVYMDVEGTGISLEIHFYSYSRMRIILEAINGDNVFRMALRKNKSYGMIFATLRGETYSRLIELTPNPVLFNTTHSIIIRRVGDADFRVNLDGQDIFYFNTSATSPPLRPSLIRSLTVAANGLVALNCVDIFT